MESVSSLRSDSPMRALQVAPSTFNSKSSGYRHHQPCHLTVAPCTVDFPRLTRAVRSCPTGSASTGSLCRRAAAASVHRRQCAGFLAAWPLRRCGDRPAFSRECRPYAMAPQWRAHPRHPVPRRELTRLTIAPGRQGVTRLTPTPRDAASQSVVYPLAMPGTPDIDRSEASQP